MRQFLLALLAATSLLPLLAGGEARAQNTVVVPGVCASGISMQQAPNQPLTETTGGLLCTGTIDGTVLQSPSVVGANTVAQFSTVGAGLVEVQLNIISGTVTWSFFDSWDCVNYTQANFMIGSGTFNGGSFSSGTIAYYTGGKPCVRITNTNTGTAQINSLLKTVAPLGSPVPAPVTQSGTWFISPNTSGGLSTFSNSALLATVTAVKASGGQLYNGIIGNPNASIVYLQLFNATTGNVTLGTTTPFMTILLPANSTLQVDDVIGYAFGTAISAACTTTATGSTAPATGCVVNLGYK